MHSDTIKSVAHGRWDEILRHLCGLSEAETTPGAKGCRAHTARGTTAMSSRAWMTGFTSAGAAGPGMVLPW